MIKAVSATYWAKAEVKSTQLQRALASYIYKMRIVILLPHKVEVRYSEILGMGGK